MDKFALMVGVSGGETGLPMLLKPRKNVEMLKRSLQSTNSGISGFEVQTVCDQPQIELAETIERFFRHRDEDDQLLFLFSGYGIQDTDEQLYLVTPATAFDDRGALIRARTIPIAFLLNVMDTSLAWRQVIIFDCCFRVTGSTEQETRMENTFNQMVGDRRVILTATTYTQPEPEPEELDAWSYTRYLAEGAATGAADTDCDGSLTVKELHHYAQRKLKIAAPNQQPQFYGSEDTANQLVLQVPSDTPIVQYRQYLEKLAETSEIDTSEFRVLTGRNRLNMFRQHLGLSPQAAAEIESEVLRPHRERQQRVQLYQEMAAKWTLRGQDESQ